MLPGQQLVMLGWKRRDIGLSDRLFIGAVCQPAKRSSPMGNDQLARGCIWGQLTIRQKSYAKECEKTINWHCCGQFSL